MGLPKWNGTTWGRSSTLLCKTCAEGALAKTISAIVIDGIAWKGTFQHETTETLSIQAGDRLSYRRTDNERTASVNPCAGMTQNNLCHVMPFRFWFPQEITSIYKYSILHDIKIFHRQDFDTFILCQAFALCCIHASHLFDGNKQHIIGNSIKNITATLK